MSNKKINEDKTISKMNVDLKNPSNAGNIKGEIDSIPRDFATLDFPCDELANQFTIPIKKTKVE